jgi:diguanylate cyclase (GGDEF)-like protein
MAGGVCISVAHSRGTLGKCRDQMARNAIFNLFSGGPETDAIAPKTALSNGTSPKNSSSEALLLLKNFEESYKGWFWSTDHDGRLTYLSDSMSRLMNEGSDRVVGAEFADLFIRADGANSARERLPFILCRHSNFEKLVVQTAQSTDGRWWELSGNAQFDGGGQFAGYRGYGVDITEQLASSEQASELAMYDPLTGLPNRLSMTKYLEAAMSGIDLFGRSCALLLVDLDRFKQVNDSLGHPAGDALLQQVSERLAKIVGDREKVFRLGGDEFQIILPQCDDREMLSGLADDIIASLSQPYSIGGERCSIGASIGMAVGPVDGRTSETLVRNGDLALYAAKDYGRGCYKFFSQELLKSVEDRRGLEEDLRDALVKGELSLFYQPQVSTTTSCVTGVEALIRWNHPVRGFISPAVFIPIAEDANLIDKLGEWIIRKACDDAANWPAAIKVAVNVSPIQFASAELPQIIISALANSGLPAGRLELELTEGIFLAESAETNAMFASLKAIGVRLALDDFGTGYSSLGYLKTSPFDKIKIDQTFVREATLPESRNRAIIAAIVALGDALSMETTAEGVETLDQLDLICSLGVSHIQGYVYSKAISTDELSEGLQSGEWCIEASGPAKQRSNRKSMYRKIGVIYGGYYYKALVRNLSDSGALIEGLVSVPMGAQLIVDFGECQLVAATVRRMVDDRHGIEFGEPLVDDGAGGLATSQKVSPYLLSKMGLSPTDYLGETRPLEKASGPSVLSLSDSFGLKTPSDEPKSGGSGIITNSPYKSGTGFGGAANRQLTSKELARLREAVEASHNPSLKYIIGLVVLTGARLQDLLVAKWEHVDVWGKVWTIPAVNGGRETIVKLSTASVDLINELPRWEDCDYMIANPITKKPYNSFFGSWDKARKKAGLGGVSIHDLRNSPIRVW